MKKLFKFTSMGFILVLAAGLIFSLALFIVALRSLPNVEKLVKSYAPSVPTTIYDSEGRVIDYISREMREEVDIDSLPPHVRDTFVAIEDRRFYTHSGIDPIRLGKAILVNISSGKAAQGGSTITQQLAKNAFLTNEKKLMRKVKEVLIAFEIERRYEKDEILEKYINEIYFGSGFYGIQTASLAIFGKEATELSLPEAALLAGIPNRPSYYNPRNNLQAAVERSHLVLRQMLSQELITREEYDLALEHKFVEEKNHSGLTPEDTSLIVVPAAKADLKSHEFIDIIKKELFDLFGEEAVYEDGLKVYTTLDLDMQEAAMDTFNEYAPFKRDEKLQGSLVTIDSKTGYVKTMVGGRNLKRGDFNRAVRAQRQPGSAFKPFIYFTALEKNIPMNAVRTDEPLKYGDWEPQNYGNNFVGDITLLEAMEKSINTISIKLMEEVGIGEVATTVEKTGVEMDIPKNLSAALGTTTTSPFDLATAYIPFSNGGSKVKPVFITEILNRDDSTIYEYTIKEEKVFNTDNIALIVHMMKDVVLNGSGRNARVVTPKGVPMEQGGKTGTTNGFRSAWYAGFTPEYVTTVYVGYDDNSSMSYGSTGGSLAAPLWKNYYQKMVDRGVYEPGRFKFIDDGIAEGSLTLVDIDSRTGLAGEPTLGESRTGLFKKGQEPAEQVRRSFLSLGGFFKRGSSEEASLEHLDLNTLDDESFHNPSEKISETSETTETSVEESREITIEENHEEEISEQSLDEELGEEELHMDKQITEETDGEAITEDNPENGFDSSPEPDVQTEDDLAMEDGIPAVSASEVEDDQPQ